MSKDHFGPIDRELFTQISPALVTQALYVGLLCTKSLSKITKWTAQIILSEPRWKRPAFDLAKSCTRKSICKSKLAVPNEKRQLVSILLPPILKEAKEVLQRVQLKR
jgi:hypothetical protein